MGGRDVTGGMRIGSVFRFEWMSEWEKREVENGVGGTWGSWHCSSWSSCVGWMCIHSQG
jgi:hypothetical protein